MFDDLFNICMRDVKLDIRRGIIECNKRGLLQSTKWLAELNFSLKIPPEDKLDLDNSLQAISLANEGIDPAEYDRYQVAKTYFDCREYDRAAFFTNDCKSPVPKFLHFYSIYMAKEKRKLDNMTEDLIVESSAANYDSELCEMLKIEHKEKKLDGYCLYLFGVILKKMDLNEMAMDVLLESVRAVPTLWAAWFELSPLVSDKGKLYKLDLPNHWMKHIFYAHTLVELFLNDEGIKLYEDLEMAGFSCFYTTSQLAIAYHNNRDVERAIEIFEELQRLDPYRLDNLDMYSNLLFVKEMRVEMAQLAHKVVKINKYRPETCCVVGNYYSIRSEHQNAILYFQRALKLNPKYLSAWTLMGHEFMETKNTNGAIQSYRKAIEVNRRDFRAWYGLGQAYEILKMPIYSLYYYKMSHQLRPSDSRMLVALGETYEKLERSEFALKCYKKACNVGDIEGTALMKLVQLYDKLGDVENALPALLSYCSVDRPPAEKSSLFKAYLRLAQIYESMGNDIEAMNYAHKCLEHEETKIEGKQLLKTLSKKQEAQQKSIPVPVPVDEGTCNEVTMDESDLVVEDEIRQESDDISDIGSLSPIYTDDDDATLAQKVYRPPSDPDSNQADMSIASD